MKERTIDLDNYIKGGSVFRRKAARGVVRRGDRYLMIYGKYGDYNFPGGGVKQGESLEEALVREVKEETGYRVILQSIQKFMCVHEKRKGDIDDRLEMDSYYYLCQVEDGVEERCLDEYEEKYEYEAGWITLDEAIEKNERVKDYETIPWVIRETMVMKELWENFQVDRKQRAMDNFMQGYNCTQSVLLAFEDMLPEKSREEIICMASAFGGGMGRLREVCGSVSGMFLVAGLLYGYSGPETGEKKAELYQKIQQLAHRFEEKNGTIVCRELLGLSVKEEPPLPEARTDEYYKKRPCRELIGMAAKILQEFIAENEV